MPHNHSHSDNHSHNHAHPDLKGKKLLLSIVLNIAITVAQVIGGLISGSLSLLSDALHNFSDVLSLIVSYIADRFSKKDASVSKTFGYKRAEIIAAFVNSVTLIIVAVYLIYEATTRFFNPHFIESGLVIWLAIFGIVFNGFSVLLLHKESKSNMNMRSAYLHLFTDMAASVAVLIGGLLMKYYEWFWVDSFLTVLIALYLLVMGYYLLKTSFKVLMLFTPDELNLEVVNDAVCKIPEIKNMHHIHIWQLNEQETHLEAHLDFHEDVTLSEFDAVLTKVEELLYQDFGINHVTIQPEHQKDDPKDIIVQD
ncbi:cation diffusion facilitator family transporter [Aequorivita sublithincola DSM 14238]|uniref:Cation diffusion facilitator family transporter n=1 Tax=Aequorivita sublithincola (strain DSM 14238 / LMG 21431 / ACAM 643 / 9-3) TaxID=746697 RepID=I3YUR8_AEQSU|nr:cation diffusion facilitator family transporter [Aequorivita sublithincola]AFL80736.1 cation diffusion facilitator family transporter [Aequorivita sublithincola DSM 14238]